MLLSNKIKIKKEIKYMQPIQEEVKRQIIDLYFKEEKSILEITNITKVNRMTVGKIISNYKKANNIDMTTRKVTFWKQKNKKRPVPNLTIPVEFLETIGINENKRNAKITVNEKTKKITLESSKKNEKNKD